MKLRRFLLLAAIVALAIVLILHRGNISDLIRLVSHIRWYILIGVVLAQLLSYLSNSLYYRSVLKIFGYDVALGRLYEASLAINFVNQIFPTGGVSGVSYLSAALKDEVPAGKATLAQLVRYAFTFMSFLVVLVFGFLFMLLAGDVTQVTVRFMLLLIIAIIFMGLMALVLISDRPRVERWSWVAVRIINRLFSRFSRRRRLITKERHKAFLDEFYHGYHLLTEDKMQWRQPLLYALYGNLAEVGTVYVVFLAFGKVLNPGVVIAAYTLANIVSLVSVVSSGAGVYEATMIGAFVALGTPFTLSFSAVLVYRTLNFLLFLPPGFYFYRKDLGGI